EEAEDYHLPPKQKALLCQRAEHEFVGVPCGIMDQFTSVLGRQDHLLRIDCRSMETTPVPFQDTDVTLLIANTNVRHSLASGEYAKRKEE
ncbi:MAG: GHMP family kinase ATP-binding protein, partial [Verrucomicrobiales bacterium]